MKSIIILFIFFYTTLVSAQTSEFKSKYTEMMRNVKNAHSFSTQVKINIYNSASPSSSSLTKTVDAQMQITNGTYYYKLYKMEYLFTKEISVLLDHSNKRILYSKVEQNADKILEQFTYSPDSLFKNCDSVTSHSKEGIPYYRVHASKSMISKMDIYLNTDNSFISKMIYYYNSDFFEAEQCVMITYSNTKTNDTSIRVLPSNTFIVKKGSTYIATPPYSSYSLIEVTKI